MPGVQYSSQALPPWLEAIYRDIAERSKTLSNLPYATYPGQRLASYANPDITQSEKLGRRTGLFHPYDEQAQAAIRTGTQRFPDQYQAYMNPYIEEVINNIAHSGNRNFNENILPALQAHFVSLGQHGSSRHGDLATRAARDIQEAILREQNQARAQGYEKAANTFAADQLRSLEGANSYGNLGKTVQAANLADVAALREQGEAQRQHEQVKADIGYGDFLRQHNFSGQKLTEHTANVHGMPHSSQAFGVEQSFPQATPQTNTAGRVGEIAGTLFGARRMMGYKRGGSISTLPHAASYRNSQSSGKHCFGMRSLKFIASKPKPQKNKVMRGRM